MTRPIYIFSGLTILIAIAFVITGIFWSVYPYKPIEFKSGISQVNNKIVKGGEHLSIVIDYCKPRDLGAETTVSFADGVIYNTPPIATNFEVGCHKKTIQLYVPKAIPAGEYHVSFLFRYKTNPIRSIDVIQNTEKFTITK
jgi:hypothetical protein